MGLRARIFVTPRRDVLDPQGSAVERALHSLGFEEVGQVRLGRYLELHLDETDQAAATRRLDAMCEQLIANPVVEDFRFELTPDTE